MTQPQPAAPPSPPVPGAGAPVWAPAAPAPAPAHEVPISPVSSVRPPTRRRRGILDVVLVVAAVFAFSGVGFAIGRVTAPATAAAATGRGNGQFQGNGQFPGGGSGGTGGNGGQAGNGGFGLGGGGITISGEVVEVTADHISLKLASGQTVQIGLSGTTTYHSQAAATATDVTVGSTVNVQVGPDRPWGDRWPGCLGRPRPSAGGSAQPRTSPSSPSDPGTGRGRATSVERRGSAPGSVPGMHLLVVEDDPRLGRLLRRLLEEDRSSAEQSASSSSPPIRRLTSLSGR